MQRMFVLTIGLALAATGLAMADAGVGQTSMFDYEMRRLHSPEVVNLRERYAGQPLLVVNTASHCGFTRQFEGLEAVHQRYREDGLKVVGFSSNDFRQEASDEAKSAEVCFENFGVTFDMFAPISVRGAEAHPLFREIARQSGEPRWNFHKYVIDREGRVTAAFPSRIEPDSVDMQRAIEKVL